MNIGAKILHYKERMVNMTTKYSKFPIIISQIIYYAFIILGGFEFFVPNFQRAVDATLSLMIAVFAYAMYIKYIMNYEKCEIREYMKCKDSGCTHNLSQPDFISDSFWFIGNILVSVIVYTGLVVSVYQVFTYRWISIVSLIIVFMSVAICAANQIRMIILIDSEKSLFRIKYLNDHSTTFEVIAKKINKMAWECRDNKAKKEVRKDLIKQGVDPEVIDNDELF